MHIYPHHSKNSHRNLRAILAFGNMLALFGILQSVSAANKTWDGAGTDNNWSTAANWVEGIAPTNTDALFFDGGVRLNNNNDLTAATNAGITFNGAAGPFTIGGNSIALTGSLINNSTNLQIVALPLQITGGNQNFTPNANGGNIAISGNITADTNRVLIVQGNGGILTLSGNNAYTGETAMGLQASVATGGFNNIGAAALKLDFSAPGAPQSNILWGGNLATSGPLTAAGGTLIVQGANNQTNSQWAASWRPSAGFNVYQLIPGSGGSVTLNLGAYTDPGNGNNRRGGTADFVIPPGCSIQTTFTNGPLGILETVGGDGQAQYVVNETDWAMNDGAGNIVPYKNYYTADLNTANTNVDVLSSGTLTANPSTLRFNQNAPLTLSISGTHNLGNRIAANNPGGGSILVTPNVGANRTVITNGTLQGLRNTAMTILNFNTNGDLEIDSVLGPNGTGDVLYTGPGRTILTASNLWTANIALTKGTLSISGNNNIGSQTAGSAISINDATLEATATFSLDNNGANARKIYLNNRGGTISVTGTNIFTVPGVISGSQASLTKTGTGILVCNGVNTYGGSTLVKQGKLVVNSAQTGTGAVTVNDGAALGINVSAALKPVALTLGSSTGATLEFSGVSSTTVAPVNTTSLTLLGTTTLNILSGSFGLGQYPLITYSNSAGAGSFSMGSVPLGMVANIVTNITATNATIALNVSNIPTPDIWTGAINANWDVATTTNWVYNNMASVYHSGDGVQFDDSGFLTNINLTTILSPASITISNSALNYLFGGIGMIASGSLLKNGGGTLTITTDNTYSGSTTINGGTVNIGNGGTSGSISNSPINNNGTLVFNRANALTYVAGINGTGPVIQNGVTNGLLSLGGVNGYQGDTTIAAGTLQILSTTAIPGGTGKGNVILSQTNSILDLNGQGSLTTSIAINGLSGIGVVDSLTNGTAQPNLAIGGNNQTSTFAGSIQNSFGNSMNQNSSVSVNKIGSGTLTLSGTNSTYTGITIVTGGILNVASLSDYADSGTTNVGPSSIGTRNFTQEAPHEFNIALVMSGGTLQYTGTTSQTCDRMMQFTAGVTSSFDASGSNPNATLKFTWNDASEYLWQGAGSRTVRLTGSNTGANAFTLHLLDQGFSPTSVIKDGPGTWYLTNSVAGQDPLGAIHNSGNSYTGSTMVNNGVLYVSTGTGDVAESGTYPFGPPAGLIGGSSYTINSGAALGAVNLDNGYKVHGQSLIANNGAIFRFANVDNTSLPVSYFTNVVVNGTCTITLDDTNQLTAGNTYPLIQYGTLNGSFALAPLPAGIYGKLTNDTANSWIALVVANTPFVNTSRTNIAFSVVSGGGGSQSLQLSWPADHLGWTLEVQTNSLQLGLSTNWFRVLGSSATNQMTIPMSITNGTVFYRLVYP